MTRLERLVGLTRNVRQREAVNVSTGGETVRRFTRAPVIVCAEVGRFVVEGENISVDPKRNSGAANHIRLSRTHVVLPQMCCQ